MDVQVVDMDGKEIDLSRVECIFVRGDEDGLDMRICVEYSKGEYVREDMMISVRRE